MRRRKTHTLQPLDVATSTQELGERRTVALHVLVDKVHAIRIHILTKQRHLGHTLIDERLHLRQNIARAAILLLTTQRRHDAERTRVIAAHRHRHPTGVGRLALRRQDRRKHLERLNNLYLGFVLHPCAIEQRRQCGDVVRAKDGVDPRCLLNHRVAILLRQTPADRNLHARMIRLRVLQLSERAIQALIRVFTHRTGIEDHQVGLSPLVCRHVPSILEQTRKTLRIVHVHLAAERPHLIGARSGVFRGICRSHGETV